MVQNTKSSLSKRMFRVFLALVLVISSFGIAGIAYGNDKSEVHPLSNTVQEDVNGESASTGSDASQNGASSSVESDLLEDNDSGDGEENVSETENGDEDTNGTENPESQDGQEKEDSDEDTDDPEGNELGGVVIDDIRYEVNDEGLLELSNGEDEEKARVAHDGVVSGNTITFKDGKSHQMTFNGDTIKSYIKVISGTTLNIDGNGTIDLTGKGGTAIIIEGEGSVLNLNKTSGCLEIKGGTGTAVHDCGKSNFGSDYIAGGAILVQRSSTVTSHVKDSYGNDICGSTDNNATLNMYNGNIHDNVAGAGGGIFIDRYCGFTMSGGTVAYNTAEKYEGGGIYVAGDKGATDSVAGSCAYISGGNVVGNTTKTTTSWGGGGIFVESKGVLKLASSLITDNTAGGLGGGVSGCPHAYIGVGKISGGAAIFGNTAHYSGINGSAGSPDNKYLKCLNTQTADKASYVYSGDMYAYGYSGMSNDKYNNANQKGDWSKAYFEKNYQTIGQDYYCTKSSIVEGSDMGQASSYAWIGYVAGSTSNSGYANGANSFGREVSIAKGNSYTAVDETLALTNTLPKGTRNAYTNGRSLTITDNTSYTHGGGIGCNGKLLLGDLSDGETIEPVSLDMQKSFVNDLGENLGVKEGQFTFEVFASNANWKMGESCGEFSTDANGRVTFQLASDKYKMANKAYFLIKEADKGAQNVTYDRATYGVIVDLTWSTSKFLLDGESIITRYTPTVTSKSFVKVFDAEGNKVNQTIGADLEVTNILNLKTKYALDGDKYYYGMRTGDDARFDFTLRAIADPFGTGVGENSTIESLVRKGGETITNDSSSIFDDGNVELTLSAKNGAYTNNKAGFSFASIDYTKPGNYFYVISEDSKQDPKVYVAEVEVVVSDREGEDNNGGATSIKAGLVKLYAGRSLDSLVSSLEAVDIASGSISFHNMDEVEGVALNGYLVSAASNVALEQRCLVDPKIYKKLVDANGKELTLQPDQFLFQLFQVNDDYTEIINPDAISSTGNDAFGMVDFDAAADVSGNPDDPCCLEFHTPGTYRYRVYEQAGYQRDPSIIYDDRVITFTAVIDNINGALVNTDMYYGYLDENGNNIRYEESEDRSWHPTLINRSAGMDIRVQKTSVADREQGLENAVYGLWMYNEDKEGDFYLGSAKSDEDGYIYFEDVNLSFGNYYYFLEEEAPDYHTVSRYRSMYFKLANTEDGGVTLVYSDTIGGPTVDENGNPVEGVVAADNNVAFTASTVALDDDGVIANHPVAMTATFATRDIANTGNELLTYLYDKGVFDELTTVNVSKLETNTHEFVEGAELAIIEKSTGRTIEKWITGNETVSISGKLNVGVQYILREVSTPAGYATADDVVFYLDDYGNITVVSGTANGNAEIQGDGLVLYDTLMDVENITYRSRTIGGLPQTGDELMSLVWVLLLVAGGACAAVGVLQLSRRRARATQVTPRSNRAK